MKIVFNNQQCAHAWAQQSQASGRGSNVRFEGDAFYSYQTVIARILTLKGAPESPAQRVALLSSQSYSVTTNGKHKGLVSRALHNRDDIAHIFRVPTVQSGGWNHDDLNHETNLAYLVEQYRERGEHLMRKQSVYHDTIGELTGDIGGYLQAATDYARCFALPDPAPHEIPPASVAKQVRERQEKMNPGRAERQAAQRAANEISERIRREQEAVEDMKRRAAWRAGEYHWRMSCEQGGAMLRIGGGLGDKVQTSHGAECPLDDARRAYRKWLYCVEHKVYWVSNGEKLGVGHFNIDAINGDTGEVKAGCHRIYRAELEHFGKLLIE